MRQFCLMILLLIQSKQATISRITRISLPTIVDYCFRLQKSEPTRVTRTSSKCLGHRLTRFPVKNKRMKTTFSDHYTVVGKIHIGTKISQEKQQKFLKIRNLKIIRGDKAVIFFLLLDQKLKLEKKQLISFLQPFLTALIDSHRSDMLYIKIRLQTIG